MLLCVCFCVFWIFVLVVCGRVSRNDGCNRRKNEWLRGCVWVREDVCYFGGSGIYKNDFVVIVCDTGL